MSWLAAGTMAAGAAAPARAWGLKTHIWIAQQVLSDALDGTVEIGGRSYRVPDHVLRALRAHPERYRAGVLGPDVYPDPLVGQTTVHPGVANGWQADDWLEWIASNADSDEEIAFSYGYATHFAGDIFAHSYVNAYAGDIFELTDGEQEVERRHVILERYIDQRMPAPVDLDGSPLAADADFRPPARFLRDVLILNGGAGDYVRVPTAYHLGLIQRVHRAVVDIEREAGQIDRRLQDYITDYMARESGLEAGADQARASLRLAEAGLETARIGLETGAERVRQAHGALVRAHETIGGERERMQAQIVEQVEQVRRLSEEARRIYDIGIVAYNRLSGELDGLASSAANFACTVYDPFDLSKCKKKARKLESRINAVAAAMNAEASKIKVAADAALQAQRRLEELVAASGEAVRQAWNAIQDGSLEQALNLAANDALVRAEAFGLAQEAVVTARQGVDKAEATLRELLEAIQRASVATNQLSTIRALVRNWIGDIEAASEAYIATSHVAGSLMYAGQGGVLAPYRRWVACYGPVFLGIPRQVGEAGCFVRDELARLREELDRLIAGLPELLRWMIAPGEELKRLAMERIEPELREAEGRLRAFVADRSVMADLAMLLADPQYGGRDKLNEVYASDRSPKSLLEFERVADLIDRDAGLDRGAADARAIPALAHSVTLAKLALLDSAELNRLIADLAPGHVSTVYGPTVYALPHPNFTLLHDAVRSLDGNHQWQGYGLPYPRRAGRLARPADLPHGRDRFREAGMGLRIWNDPVLRQRVFLTLFPTAIVGALGQRPELRAPLYPFPSCPENPFPRTQADDGAMLAADPACAPTGGASSSP